MRPVLIPLFAVSALWAQSPAETEFFEKNIRPVLAAGCQGCHNAKLKSAGLDLSTAEGFRQGGQSGPLVSKESPAESRLLKTVSYDERLKMPPTGKLPARQLADLEAWVKMGAPWPGAGSTAQAATAITVRKGGRNFSEAEKKFWSFQPVRSPAPPKTAGPWARNAIDRFIQAKLDEKGLKPAKPTGKLTLLRRATFDLHGLPPSETEIADFLADDSPEAFRKVVDRLLESPRYGERWGRHWLDLARYADSTGNDEDHRYPYAWRYRDYVIDSFNRDVPYDRFVTEQLAGDLLPAPPGEPVNRRGIVATGYLALGAKAIAQQDKKKMLYDVWDEQLDVLSKSMLGLTLSCSRCHDHKFDPLLQRDYYSIVNFFANTRSFKDSESHVSKLLYTPLVSKEEFARYQAHQDKLANLKSRQEDLIEGEKERYNRDLTPRLADYMLAARAVEKDGAKAEDIAAERKLDADLVKKWVRYLKTDYRKKPHMEPWAKADAESAAAVAAEYRKGYEATMAKWTGRVAKWRELSRKMLKEMNMPPPPKPAFAAEEDGFFHDVYIAGGPFAMKEKDVEKILTADAKGQLDSLKTEQESLKKNAPPEPEMACAVEEGDPVKQHVLIRGDYTSLGEEAPKSFPLILSKSGDPQPGEKGSGRLDLARWIASKDNPLTARVAVNRVWQWHFGEGLVRTPDNFGRMGEKPTHPELLDWLAARFVEDGWSFKKLHREIMNSAAYRMSSEPSPEALEKDPGNRLFSRFVRRRLAVEEMRDGLLSIDGSIDLAMGGSLQSGFGTDGENNQGRLSINPDKQVRRTVYMPLRRANLPALLNLFDFGDATTVQGRRISTNVAPQALFMLNSEFLTERSANLAKAIVAGAGSDAQRLEAAYLRTLNRKPSAGEVDAGLTYVGEFEKRFPSAGRAAGWQSMCRVLMASNDFIYVD